MKNRLFIILTAVIIVSVVIFFVTNRSPQPRFVGLEDIPAPQQHEHVSPSGEIVSHTHIYEPLTPQLEMVSDLSAEDADASTSDYMKTNRIQRRWERLDLKEMKRWQIFTIEEMHEKFLGTEVMDPKQYPEVYKEQRGAELDQMYPRDKFLQRCMDLGHPFNEGWHYRDALGIRSDLRSDKEVIEEGTEKDRAWTLQGVALPPHATFEEYEDLYIKRWVLSHHAHDEFYRNNPDSEASGGVYMGGAFVPFESNTVYAYISEEGMDRHFIGPTLTKAEEEAITMFGIAPLGMNVVYTDKDGVPLPPDVKPRFYERAIAELDAAKQQVARQIADHDALFNQAENETGQKAKPIVGETQHEHLHPHEEVSPTRPTQIPGTQRNGPPQVKNNVRPPPLLPDEPHDPAQIERWFEELILLHGGDLPKDLKALQKVITELKAIRKTGEEKIPDSPRRPSERPVPPKTPSEQ
ncbi:hypothetical protein C6501_14920 [Candidatus Poribacteria bacterium]|nr:MAG: hypothetical protein C6501_14920 [Candidatus Poribacteria bacterium]